MEYCFQAERQWTAEEALDKLRTVDGDPGKIEEWNAYRDRNSGWSPNLSKVIQCANSGKLTVPEDLPDPVIHVLEVLDRAYPGKSLYQLFIPEVLDGDTPDEEWVGLQGLGEEGKRGREERGSGVVFGGSSSRR